MPELIHDVGRRVASFDIDCSCHATFDEKDGTLNLEWMAPNCRVGAAFSPTPNETAWWFVSKGEGPASSHITGPHNDFDDRFIQSLRRVAQDGRQTLRAKSRQPTNWWRHAFVALATFNAVFWLLR